MADLDMEPNMGHGTGIVTADRLNVREWAGTDAKVLGQLAKGTRVEIWATRKRDGWLLIVDDRPEAELPDDPKRPGTKSRLVGWVSGEWVEVEGALVRASAKEASMDVAGVDPRDPNCQGFHIDATNRVDGVLLDYEERPDSKYRLAYAALIGEAAAGGQQVAAFAVRNAMGIEVAALVWLAWEWPKLTDGRLLPGNQQQQHIIWNGYDAARGERGPLALYVGDGQGNVLSDVIGAVGLPNNRHVCYRFVWEERGAAPDTGADNGSAIAAMHADLRALANHLGLPLPA